MPTVEIPRSEWPQFFNQFTAQHRGWRCTIEILGDAIGAQIQSDGLGLEGIDAGPPSKPSIHVALGDSPEAHLSHVIDAPEHVWHRGSADEEDESIEIEGGQLKTLLHVRRSLSS